MSTGAYKGAWSRGCWWVQCFFRASLAAQLVKNPPAVQTTAWSLGWEDALEKGMATHSSILAWRIPWTDELCGPQSMGSHGHWATEHTHVIMEGSTGWWQWAPWSALQLSGERATGWASRKHQLCPWPHTGQCPASWQMTVHKCWPGAGCHQDPRWQMTVHKCWPGAGCHQDPWRDQVLLKC